MLIGVLALQGDFAAHAAALRACGATPVEVRRTSQLRPLDGLVIPGGESTTLLNLMRDEAWFDALKELGAEGTPVFGTCAGAILLARDVEAPVQPSLAMLDVGVRRNGYGRQVDSFEAPVDVTGWERPFDAVFIRAPLFTRVGDGVKILARHDGRPVLVRDGGLLAATFHPELTDDNRIHGLFVNMVEQARRTVQSAEPARA